SFVRGAGEWQLGHGLVLSFSSYPCPAYRPSPLRRGGLPQPYFRREPALTTFFVPGEGFLAAVFLAVLFFAVDFLAVVFLAVIFLAVVFFAVDFLVVFLVAPLPSAACFG